MAEGKKHKDLKRVAEAVLKMEGYEVETEKFLAGSRVDVFGTKNGEEVAVELGHLENERADYLKQHVDRLTHIPHEEYDPNGPSETESKTRANVSLNGDEWEELSELVGRRNRSKLIRDFITVYLNLHKE